MTDVNSTASKMEADRQRCNAYARRYYHSKKDRVTPEQKAARAEYLKVYHAANKEKIKAQRAEKYESMKDAHREKSKAHYFANKETILERNRKRRRENPGRHRKSVVKWFDEHPGMNLHYVRLRQIRKQQATPQWADLEAIKAIYKEAARLKKETGQDWHVDHAVPLKHKLVCGLHVPANLQILLASVNARKHCAFETE